jgi:hypothetical protein
LITSAGLRQVTAVDRVAAGVPGEASLVAPMREMSMMAGALMVTLIPREPIGAWRLIGRSVPIGRLLLSSA